MTSDWFYEKEKREKEEIVKAIRGVLENGVLEND